MMEAPSFVCSPTELDDVDMESLQTLGDAYRLLECEPAFNEVLSIELHRNDKAFIRDGRPDGLHYFIQ